MCAECGDEFVLQSQLSLHLEEHRKELSGVKVFTCKTCNEELKTSALLKEHMKTHVKMRSESQMLITLTLVKNLLLKGNHLYVKIQQ